MTDILRNNELVLNLPDAKEEFGEHHEAKHEYLCSLNASEKTGKL